VDTETYQRFFTHMLMEASADAGWAKLDDDCRVKSTQNRFNPFYRRFGIFLIEIIF
jgi:hypothetical protein